MIGVTRYGEAFPSVVARGNVWGAQFHPEKSSDAGLRLVRSWVDMARRRADAREASVT